MGCGLKAAGVPCGSVREVGEVLEDPQLDARQMIETVEHITAGAIRVLGVPDQAVGHARRASGPPRRHSASTPNQILEGDCGMTPGEIARNRGRRGCPNR